MRPRPRLPVQVAAAVIALVTAAALRQRLGGLAPPSLWLDDQWVAALATAAPASFLFSGDFPCPPGFVLVLRALAITLGPGEWQLQLLPLLAGLAAIPLLGWAAYRATGDPALGVIAAVLLAGSPALSTYSLRVKPFAVDALATVLLLALSVAARRSGRTRSFAWLAFAAALLPLVSFPALLVGAALVHAIGVERLRQGAGARTAILRWIAGYDLAALAVVAATFHGRGNAAIREHWLAFYLPLDDPGAVLPFLAENGWRVLAGAFPAGLQWAGLLVPVGAVMLLARRRDRPLGIALAAVYAALLVLSALGRYPLGGGRTDLFSHPLAVFAVVAALSALPRGTPVWARVPALLAASTLALGVFGFLRDPTAYPASGGAAIVRRAAAVLEPGDGLVVYPWSNWAVAHYGPWPVEPADEPASTNGFYLIPRRPHSLVLRESWDGVRFQADPAPVRGQLVPFLQAAPDRLVYLADRGPRAPHEWIVRAILGAGYGIQHQELHHGAILMVFRRSAPLPEGAAKG